MSELLKGIKNGKGRSQRSALEKFAILIQHINPQKYFLKKSYKN